MKKHGRGMGGVYQPSYTDKKAGERVVLPTWWIYFNAKGKQVKESSHSTKEADAWKLLRKRLGEVSEAKPVGPDVTRTKFEDLMGLLVDDHKANSRRSTGKLQTTIDHPAAVFAGDKAQDITTDRLTKYIAYRRQGQAAAATINLELTRLGRAFTLAVRSGKASGKPYIPKLKLNNARKGFFEIEQFQAVLQHLPEEIKPVAVTAYVTGWRVPSEILTRQRHHLDLKNGWLRLDPGETKTNEGRNFPLTPMLREALERQVKKTEALRAEGIFTPWLFHRQGKPIKNFRRSWITACTRAGLGTEIRDINGKLLKRGAKRIPHDFRRTAVRNLERAGVPRSAAMKLVGHQTVSIYQRYAIADEGMLKDAASKLAGLHERDETELSKAAEK
jgi:integrase